MRRNRNDVIIDVLKCLVCAGKPLIFTHIMYSANLNAVVLKDVLDRLIRTEFIRVLGSPNRKRYAATTKAFDILRAHARLKEVFNSTFP